MRPLKSCAPDCFRRGVEPRYAPPSGLIGTVSGHRWCGGTPTRSPCPPGHTHQSPCRFVGLCFLADALVEGGLLLLDLLVFCKRAIDDGPQHMLIEQAAHVVAELSADR
jgi:hypothetical protein